MADQTPFAQLTGTWKFWVAATGTAMPALDDATLTGFTALGKTDGDQAMLRWMGALVGFSDNERTGMTKHVRPEEGFEIGATLVDLTLENMAYTLSMPTAAVVGGTSGALTTKKLALRRGFIPTRYTILARGGAIVASNTMSPYGAWPAQLYIPQGVFDGEPEETFSKGGRPGIAFNFKAEWYESASAGEEFGILIAQSA